MPSSQLSPPSQAFSSDRFLRGDPFPCPLYCVPLIRRLSGDESAVDDNLDLGWRCIVSPSLPARPFAARRPARAPSSLYLTLNSRELCTPALAPGPDIAAFSCDSPEWRPYGYLVGGADNGRCSDEAFRGDSTAESWPLSMGEDRWLVCVWEYSSSCVPVPLCLSSNSSVPRR